MPEWMPKWTCYSTCWAASSMLARLVSHRIDVFRDLRYTSGAKTHHARAAVGMPADGMRSCSDFVVSSCSVHFSRFKQFCVSEREGNLPRIVASAKSTSCSNASIPQSQSPEPRSLRQSVVQCENRDHSVPTCSSKLRGEFDVLASSWTADSLRVFWRPPRPATWHDEVCCPGSSTCGSCVHVSTPRALAVRAVGRCLVAPAAVGHTTTVQRCWWTTCMRRSMRKNAVTACSRSYSARELGSVRERSSKW